ncbi:hypothetical protein [Synechococcus phage Yong-M3-232]|nr:hypothetical protein [Synechococcus phage Yong-M3-232]
MIFSDALTLDAPKRLTGGYVAVRARAARVGVYDYAGREVDPENKHGLRDKALVKVLRDEQTVFDDRSARSFIGKPVTDNHPAQPVTADNWRQHARGTVMGAMRDGDYLAFDLLLTDAAAIAAVEGGKRELSNGYAADLEFGRFTAPDGTVCDARQTSVTGNHVAIVDRGRAGSECAIRDAAICDAITAERLAELTTIIDHKEPSMATITIDGLPVSLADEAAVRAVLDKKDAAIAAGEKALADAKAGYDKDMAEKDAEIDDLKAKVVDQAQIDALADAKAEVVAKARAVVGDKLADTKGKTVAEVRRMALDAKGIECVDKSDDYVEARFDALTADAVAKPVVQNIAPAAATITDAAAVVNTIRLARY